MAPLSEFFDQEPSELLRLDMETELPLYAVALGAPDGSDDDEAAAFRRS